MFAGATLGTPPPAEFVDESGFDTKHNVGQLFKLRPIFQSALRSTLSAARSQPLSQNTSERTRTVREPLHRSAERIQHRDIKVSGRRVL